MSAAHAFNPSRTVRRLLPIRRFVPSKALFLAATISAILPDFAPAQDKNASNPSPISAAQLRTLMDRIDRLEREVRDLRGGGVGIPQNKDQQKLVGFLEEPSLGTSYYGVRGGSYYFAGKLALVNMTNKPISIPRESVELVADNQRFKYGKLPTNMRNMSVQTGTTSISLSNMNVPESYTLPPGGMTSSWVRFINIPKSPTTPRLKLEIASQNLSIDINRIARQQLDLKAERIGPRGSLALLSIGGPVNPISAGAIIDELQGLADKKVVRCVLRWNENAPPLNSQARSWLTMSANNIGVSSSSSSNSSYPRFPSALRELHLAQLPGNSSRYYPSSSFRSPTSKQAIRIHKSDSDAIVAALKSVYERIPRDELMTDIIQGSKHTRVAAIATGGGRLPQDKLPMLLDLAEDNDPDIQLAALQALGHFGTDIAVEKLVKYVQKNTEPLATAAINGLATSRFPAAHTALLEVLKNEPPASRKRIVTRLAAHPRAVWADTIYEYASDPNSGMVKESLVALGKIGHPKLTELLSTLIQGKDANLKTQAFAMLADRKDPESEKIALQYTMEHMEQKPPTSTMLNLIQRTEYRDAIPKLVEYFQKERNNRINYISTLAAIGDQNMIDIFLKAYPKLDSSQQIAVLNFISRLKPQEYRRLAADALQSTNSSLVNSVSQGLVNDGSPEAIALLEKTLRESTRSITISYVSRGLGTLGNLDARKALRQAFIDLDEKNQRYIKSAFQTLQQRSPAYSNWRQGLTKSDNPGSEDEVLQLYQQAIEADPEFPEVWASRGHVLLHQQKFDDALEHFAKAAELDPYEALGVTGQGIALVQMGKIQEGIDVITKATKRFPKDSLFAYNSACVYGCALKGQTNPQGAEDSDGRPVKEEKWKDECLKELARAVKLGFTDFEHIDKDPDLEAVRDTARYREILAPLKEAAEKEAADAGKD